MVRGDLVAVVRSPFGFLAVGAFVSKFGDVMASLGFVLFSYKVTRSAGDASLLGIIEVAPYLVAGIAAGVVADMIPKLLTMRLVNAIRMLVEVLAGVVAMSGNASFVLVVAVAFILQCGGVFFNPCNRAVIATIVPREQRVAANSVTSMGENIANIVGPLAASTLFGLGASVGSFMLIDGATFAVSVVCLAGVSKRVSGEVNEHAGLTLASVRERVVAKLVDFYGAVKHDRTLSGLLASTFTTIFCNTWCWRLGLLLLTISAPGGSSKIYASLMSWSAVVGLIISFIIPLVFTDLSLWHYRGCVLLWAVGLAVLGFGHRNVVLLASGVVLVTFGSTVCGQARMFLLQERLPAQVSGQGFAAAAVLLYLADATSLAVFGFVSHEFGVVVTVCVAAVVMFVSGVALIVSGRSASLSV